MCSRVGAKPSDIVKYCFEDSGTTTTPSYLFIEYAKAREVNPSIPFEVALTWFYTVLGVHDVASQVDIFCEALFYLPCRFPIANEQPLKASR